MSKNKYHTFILFHKSLITKAISMIDNYYPVSIILILLK